MSLQDRMITLKTRHEALDSALCSEAHRPLPDPEMVARLKREKLRLKDEIVRLGTA